MNRVAVMRISAGINHYADQALIVISFLKLVDNCSFVVTLPALGLESELSRLLLNFLNQRIVALCAVYLCFPDS